MAVILPHVILQRDGQSPGGEPCPGLLPEKVCVGLGLSSCYTVGSQSLTGC